MSEVPFGADEARAVLPRTPVDANKYTRGTVLVAAGSESYPGAAVLAARAASRSGAGYVKLAAPASAVPVARQHLCSIPVCACADEDGAFAAAAADDVLHASAKSSVIVAGPGLTVCDGTAAFVEGLLLGTGKPVVLDADTLNIVASRPAMLEKRAGCVTILTPHEGEAARLLGHAVGDRADSARELAERFGATVVLKGPRTLVADAQGSMRVCANAGPELAKAGTGDVLAGMVGAFAAQGLAAGDAACLAVYIHGAAGQLAAQRMSAYSVDPEDVIEHIGPALLRLAAGQ